MKELVYLLIVFVIIKEGSCACRIIPKAYNIKGRCPMPEVAYTIPQYGMAVTVMEPYCERCECSRRGASCCSLYGKPTNIAKSCKIIYNNCKPKVVRKDDESVECPVYAMVG